MAHDFAPNSLFKKKIDEFGFIKYMWKKFEI